MAMLAVVDSSVDAAAAAWCAAAAAVALVLFLSWCDRVRPVAPRARVTSSPRLLGDCGALAQLLCMWVARREILWSLSVLRRATTSLVFDELGGRPLHGTQRDTEVH